MLLTSQMTEFISFISTPIGYLCILKNISMEDGTKTIMNDGNVNEIYR